MFKSQRFDQILLKNPDLNSSDINKILYKEWVEEVDDNLMLEYEKKYSQEEQAYLTAMRDYINKREKQEQDTSVVEAE